MSVIRSNGTQSIFSDYRYNISPSGTQPTQQISTPQSASIFGAHRDPSNQYLVGAAKDIFLDMLGLPEIQATQSAVKFVKRVDLALTTYSASQNIRSAMQYDAALGDKSYTQTIRAIHGEIADFAGQSLATTYVKSLLHKGSSASVIGMLLGPNFIQDALHDFPLALKEVARITGFQLTERGVKFAPSEPYNPRNETAEYYIIERQRAWHRAIRPYLKKFQSWLRSLARR